MSLERVIQGISSAIFDHRRAWLVVFAIATALFAASASRLAVDAGFSKMVPLSHPYMKVYREYEKEFGGANRVAIALMQKDGDIFDKAYMAKLKGLTNDVFLLNGIDRPTVKSLFTPNTRFIEVVEEGFSGGNVIPATFQGTPADLATVRTNVEKSTEVGRTVANDFSGALVVAGLLEIDPQSQPPKRLDYFELSHRLEELRAKYTGGNQTVHIIGFAKAVGDIRDGARGVILFFGIAFAITLALMIWFVKDVKLTLVALVVAMMPVLWLLGTLPVLGFGIDPLSILVPFLIFSIGVSHAVQMTKTWEREVASGSDGLTASRRAFARLFIPGTLALLTNVLGFAVIMLIPIDIVRELGITASLGVGWMILTNKALLPILLSYLRLSRSAVHQEAYQESRDQRVWRAASHCVDPGRARAIVAAAVAILALGLWQAHHLKVGDYGIGVPELRPDSRYNLDNATIVKKFAIGVNTLGVVAQTHDVQGACTRYDIMSTIERFDWYMQNVPGTQSVISLPGMARIVNAGFNEGNPKWRQLPRDPQVMAQSVSPIDTSTGLLNPDCSAMQVLVNTTDQQGETIARLVAAVKTFAAEHDSPQLQFKLATGNMGVAAATNEAVDKARWEMNLAIFGALLVMCMATFRSLRATLCILIPLAIVSVLCEALMPTLGIGLKVSTLPVIALGVGVGVDYGIYLYDRIEKHLEEGKDLATAFYEALNERGTAMVFTAVTMTIGVATWAFSALKFQADMGVLLAFMFFLNMVGALFLLPALAAFLLGRHAARRRAG
ncbi:MAG TPA: efflux RND transporter permease subunit [Usitatibacter sp.]|nr:efflux RND transporter permease subunit [Usitatibacter sp.]